MTQSHFQDEESLKAQHISEEEATQVVALWAERQRERERRAAEPTVQVVAEGLDIPADEVLRLLNEVRAREASVQAPPVVQMVHRQGARRSWRTAAIVIAAGIVVWVLLVAVFVARTTVPAPTAATAVSRPTADVTVTDDAGTTYVRRADGSVSLHTPDGTYEYRPDGSLTVSGPEGNYRRAADGSVEVSGSNGSYIRRADGSVERYGNPPKTVTPPPPPPGVALPAMPAMP